MAIDFAAPNLIHIHIVKTDVQDINPTRKVISITATSKEVSDQEAKLIKDFQRQAKIPGFRPGKAPENMVRQRFAKDIQEELKQRVVSQAHQEGVAGAEFEVFTIVELDEGEVKGGQEATITFTVDVIPEFEVPAYEGLKVTNTPTKASDEEVTKMLDQVLGQRADYNVADKFADKGDYVQCAYEGKIGDDAVADLVPDAPMFGTQANTWEEAGNEDAPGVRAIVDGLVGMKAGDTKEVTMEFPEDFKPEALAGKAVIYSIEAKEVREKVMPEMNDAFFESMQVKDETELRTKISENIENQKKQQNADSERQQITEELVKAVDFPVPESGVKNETEAVLRDFMQRNIQQGVSAEEFEKHKESLHEGASKAAHDRFKSRLILTKIAEKEKIKVENEDFSRMIMMEAQQSGQNPDKLVKELQKDQNRVNQMRRDIILGKTMDLLSKKAEREIVEPAEVVGD